MGEKRRKWPSRSVNSPSESRNFTVTRIPEAMASSKFLNRNDQIGAFQNTA
jgi:hypothetical protein